MISISFTPNVHLFPFPDWISTFLALYAIFWPLCMKIQQLMFTSFLSNEHALFYVHNFVAKNFCEFSNCSNQKCKSLCHFIIPFDGIPGNFELKALPFSPPPHNNAHLIVFSLKMWYSLVFIQFLSFMQCFELFDILWHSTNSTSQWACYTIPTVQSCWFSHFEPDIISGSFKYN